MNRYRQRMMVHVKVKDMWFIFRIKEEVRIKFMQWHQIQITTNKYLELYRKDHKTVNNTTASILTCNNYLKH